MEDASPIKHEYFRGEIFAMAGASGKHLDITGNVSASLHDQLRGRSCRTRIAQQRIKVERNSLQTYPDIVVVCPPFVRDPNSTITLMDATLIIEVLSPSTARYDKNDKFRFYQDLPSLRHYLTVDQDKIEVIHNFWQNGEWAREEFTSLEGEIRLAAIDCVLLVCDVYEDIEWE